MSRNQLIDEVNKWLRRFDISEEEILTAAELDRLHLEAYRRNLPETDNGRLFVSNFRESDEEKETLENLMCFLNLLTEAKRHNLMCLLYLGRDIGYYGLTKSVVSSFVSYAEEWGKVPRKSLSGCHRPEYLAGKPISKWLGQVKQELNAGTLPDDVWKVTLFKGYRFPGPFHQHHPYSVPVMDDGTKYQCSFRHWGDIMARALGLDGQHAYVTWAFSIPPNEEAILPSPEDWGEEESEEHIQRYEEKEEQTFEP